MDSLKLKPGPTPRTPYRGLGGWCWEHSVMFLDHLPWIIPKAVWRDLEGYRTVYVNVKIYKTREQAMQALPKEHRTYLRKEPISIPSFMRK